MTDSKDTDQTPTLEEIKDEELDVVSGGAVNALPAGWDGDLPPHGGLHQFGSIR